MERRSASSTNPWETSPPISAVLPDPTILTATSSDQAEAGNSDNIGKLPFATVNRRQDSYGSPTQLPPYRDYTDTSGFVDPPRRRTTVQSFRSTASSIWSKTKDFGVSHFTVPRLAAPWQHELSEKEGIPPESSTVRQFDHQRQRRRLFTNSAFQLFVTIFLCGSLAACLAGFQTIVALYTNQKHAFNALVTGLSIALGLNLASSFQGYAQMMRWRFLASNYRSLQEFELVLQCDSQMKVFRLLWTARTRSKLWVNKTQWLCLLWITINVLLQVLVAMLGLTYSLDTSDWVNANFGDVSICNLGIIEDLSSDFIPDYWGQLGAANSYGIQGQDYPIYDTTDPSQQLSNQAIYTDDNNDYFEYRFQDLDPNDTSVTVVSDRTITSTATCLNFTVTDGGWGGTDSITYIDENGKSVTMFVDLTSPGAMTFIGNTQSKCGRRCTEVIALQTADNYSIFEPGFFKCQSFVSHVDGISEYLQPGQHASLYDMPDLQAQILAGSIGWSGFSVSGSPYEYRMYSQESYWSPYGPVDKSKVAQLITTFSMSGVAAMDYIGPRLNVTGWYPVTAELVTVEWHWAALILAVVPTIQLLALLSIIAWANKAIIKDTSFLSTARLLRPVVDKLGNSGCLLTGDEIAEEMKNVRVAYGYREPPGFVDGGNMVRHVDMLEESEGLGIHMRMPQGRYDGL